jgi:hypothetical protein
MDMSIAAGPFVVFPGATTPNVPEQAGLLPADHEEFHQ